MCSKQNIHNRSEYDIRKAIEEWIATPLSYTSLSYDCLFTNDMEENMEDISDEEKAHFLDTVSISDDDGNNDNNADNADENFSDDDEAFNEVRLSQNFTFY